MNNKDITTRSQALEYNQNRRKKFIDNNVSIKIPLSKIMLTDNRHLNSKVDFSENALKLQQKGINALDSVIMVRPLKDDIYALVMGFRSYKMAQVLGQSEINCIVTDMDSRKFKKLLGIIDMSKPIGTDEMKLIEEIVIPEEFKMFQPKQDKINEQREYFNMFRRFTKPIEIKGNMLINGYIRYLVALELGLRKIPVKFV